MRDAPRIALFSLTLACGARTELSSSEDGGAPADATADRRQPPPAACVPGPPQAVVTVSDSRVLVPSALAVDDDTVYFVDEHESTAGVSAAPKRGGPSRPLASGEADALLVDDSAVYMLSAAGGISRVPKGGGAATPLVKQFVTSMALDGDSLYYTTFASVLRIPKAGGNPVTVVRGEQGKLVREVRVVDGALFWLSDAIDVFTAAKDGSGARVLVHGNQVDDYFADGTRVYAWNRDRGGNGALLAALVSSGGATTLVSDVISAAPVYSGGAADGNGVVYWTGLAGAPSARGLLATSKNDGTTRAAWSGEPGFAVVADDACVYWIAGRVVMRVAK